MKKRRKPLALKDPQRIEFLVPKDLMDEAKRLLAPRGISLSRYLRQALARLVLMPNHELRGLQEENPNEDGQKVTGVHH